MVKRSRLLKGAGKPRTERLSKVNQKNLVTYIMSFEEGSLSQEDTIELFSYLIKTKMAWSLQGSIYGRPAKALIDRGVIDNDGTIHWDKVPVPEEHGG